MLDSIIRFALKNRIAILALATLLCAAGLFTAGNMEVDVFPDLNAPTVVVMTEAEGMAPEEVERLVTFPIETAVNGATHVRRVRSSSSMGFSIVYIEFDWGTDLYKARQIASEKLAMLGDRLPPQAGTPTLGPQSSILGELLIISLTSDTTSMQDLRTLADWSLRPRLLSVSGVAQVTVHGGDIREYQIQLDPRRMRSFGVTLNEVAETVRDMNRNASGGTVNEYGNEYIVRGLLSTDDLEALQQAIVKRTADGRAVMLETVADVVIGSKVPKLGAASKDGKPAVLLTVTKQPNISTLKLTAQLDAALADLAKTLPGDIAVRTDTFRQASFIETSVRNVEKSLWEGGLFVAVILFIFLMNWRTTVISLVSIPLSILVTLLTLRASGMTLNTMSLGGIAIAIGSLVDDSIVDVENVYKRLFMQRDSGRSRPQEILQTVYEASREVRLPMLNSTLIIVASFLPLFFLSGMEAKMLRPLGISFIISLFTSTLVALTLTPVLSYYLLGKDRRKPHPEPFWLRGMKRRYSRMLAWTLDHPTPVFVGTGTLLAVALGMFFSLGRNFLPAFNEGSFTVTVGTVPGITLENSDAVGRLAERMLLDIPEIKTVGRKTGRAELDEHSFGVNESEFECPFTLAGRSRAELFAEVREKLGTLPGVNIEIGGPIAHRIDQMLSGTKAGIAIKIFGTDLHALYRLGNEVKSVLSEIPGITDVNMEQQVERPELKIVPKREILARYGITLPEFSVAVRLLLGGEVVSQVYEGDRAFDLTLKVQDQDRANLQRIGDLPVDVPSADASVRKVPLSSIADIRSSVGPNAINREDVSRKMVVSCNVSEGGLSKKVAEIRRNIEAQVALSEGYRIEYGGQFESAERATRTIALVSLISIALIFSLLFGEFKNAGQSLVILLNLPLALIGGVFAIFLTDGMLSIPAIIGFISLFGIATRNGMLLIDRYNILSAEGLPGKEAVIRGSLDRLNPILMTAVTSALALMPLALGGDLPGNEIQSPMAKVILGGLFTSTLLNGFVIPIMFLKTIHKNNHETILDGNSGPGPDDTGTGTVQCS